MSRIDKTSFDEGQAGVSNGEEGNARGRIKVKTSRELLKPVGAIPLMEIWLFTRWSGFKSDFAINWVLQSGWREKSM